MITILMATYQGEKYLREQLDSILNQTEQDWRLEICDDGSKDATVAIAEEYAARYPEKIVVHRNEENRGSTKNFLAMLVAAEGDYIMFADQDDIWHADKLQRTLHRMKQLERRYGKTVPALVCTDAVVVDEQGGLLQPSFTQLQHFDMRRRTLPHLLMENLCIGCTTMLNRALVKLVDTLPEQARYHDWWVALIAAAFGHISYLAVPTLDYRQHGNNVVGTQDFAAYVKQRVSKLSEMKNVLAATYAQAEEFLALYGEHPGLSAGHQRELAGFLALRDAGVLKRRLLWLRGGYFKSRLVRNLGLLIVM